MSRDNLTAFSEWLRDVRGMAYTSSITYASNVRRLLYDAGGNDLDAEAVWRSLGAQPDHLKAGMRCAWSAYVDWCEATRPRVRVPARFPVPPKGRRRHVAPGSYAAPPAPAPVQGAPMHGSTHAAPPAPAPVPANGVPPELRAKLTRLSAVLPELADLLPRCTWAHVTDAAYEIDGEPGQLIMIAPRTQGLILPKSALSMLMAWGRPAGPSAPLLPREPGAPDPMSSWALRTLATA